MASSTELIPLTRGKLALVDEADVELVMSKKWYAQYTQGLWYAARDERKMPLGKVLYMHNFITGFTRTDHKDGYGLNNTRENLRDATQSQNVGNSKKVSGCTSKYKGVSWYPRTGSWRVYIEKEGKRTYLGLHKDEICAALTYDEAARKVHGEFAVLNFPDVGERSAITGSIRMVM